MPRTAQEIHDASYHRRYPRADCPLCPAPKPEPHPKACLECGQPLSDSRIRMQASFCDAFCHEAYWDSMGGMAVVDEANAPRDDQ